MPTYMYKCAECGHRFEAVQGFHDDPLDTCPDCGGAVRRVIGNVGVTFKGSGFYRTDSRTSSTPKKQAAASSTEGKKEAAPAAKESKKDAPKGTSTSTT